MGAPLYKPADKKRILQIDENRDPFRRDNGRLIHSAVFRRLQGKTQLYPCYESDFFRNRLTHSLEVAQIAKGIAEKVNEEHKYFQKNPISLDLVETAALAHDLGHPPFGHNGEKALDDCMKKYGGFEGNAQTLRIITKLEKKNTFGKEFKAVTEDGEDNRCGLNLTYRTIASILKYDTEIPKKRQENEPRIKGYYYTERDIVEAVRSHVLSRGAKKEIRTIECQIMDIADDIAYSTYDLEDAFKAEFLTPMKMLASDRLLLERVATKVKERLRLPRFGIKAVQKVLFENYQEIFIEDIISFAAEKEITRWVKVKKQGTRHTAQGAGLFRANNGLFGGIFQIAVLRPIRPIRLRSGQAMLRASRLRALRAVSGIKERERRARREKMEWRKRQLIILK